MPDLEFIKQQLLSNQLLTGGAVLGSLGLLLRWLTPKMTLFLWWLRNRFIVTVVVNDEFQQFKWVSYWVAEHPYTQKAKRVSFDSYIEVEYKELTGDRFPRGLLEQRKIPKLLVSVAPGWHLLWHNWRPIILERVMDKLEQKGGENDSSIRYEWHLSIFGTRAYADKLFGEMEACYQRNTSKGVSTYVAEKYGGFKACHQVKQRSFESVLLPPEIKEEVFNDLKEFLASEKWYDQRHIPWRRGYLFEGVPGTGKTSLIKALATEFQLNLYMIPLHEVDDEDLLDLFNRAKEGIVLLEDIDCLYHERSKVEGGATFSGLLNALDGALSLDGRIVVMTTNHPEHLDGALIRPGRIDRRFHFGYAKAREISQLYKRFFPQGKLGDVFGRVVERCEVTMAEVQGYLLMYRNSSHEALRNVNRILEMREERKKYDAEVQANELRSEDASDDSEGN